MRSNMLTRLTRTIGIAARGLATAVRARPGAVLGITAAVVALDVLLPPLVLAVARQPWTYFTFNPWLKRLPGYLISDAPFEQKLDFLSRMAWFWFTAEGPYGFPEWGFAVDTMDGLRFFVTGGLIGLYFALLLDRRRSVAPASWTATGNRGAGVTGTVASVLGLSTGPCSVVGCGAPVLPVVGLAFAGLSSGTLALLSGLSRAVAAIVIVALVVSIAYLSYRTGCSLPTRQTQS
jgi:hypothetical protein